MSRKKIPDNLKPYIGRIFKLGRHETIYVGDLPVDGYSCNKKRVQKSNFGEAVFVIDESLKKVRVADKYNTYHWISKTYLGHELKTQKTINEENLNRAIKSLIDMQKMLVEKPIEEIKEQLIEKTKEASADIKSYLDFKQLP